MEKLKKVRENIIVMLVLAVACTAILFWGIPTYVPVPSAAQGQSFTPRTMPYILMTVVAVCIVIELYNSVRAYIAAKKELEASGEVPVKVKKTAHDILSKAMPYMMFAIVVLYGVMINQFGFIISTAVIIPVILLVIGCRKWHYYAIVYAFAAIMWTIFKILLKVQLP